MAAYKKIQGNSIKPFGARPTGEYGKQITSTVPRVGNVKGGPNLGATKRGEYFMHTQVSGHVSVLGGQHV